MEFIYYYGYVALKLGAGLIVFLLILRTTGRGNLSQMTPIDLISNFVMGGIIGGVIYNSHIGIMQLILVLCVWQALVIFLNLIGRFSPVIKRFIAGGDVALVVKGEFQVDTIKKENIDVSEFITKLRIKGCALHEVAFARLESNGDLSVIRREEEKSAVILIQDGEIHEPCLKELGKNKAWLKQELKKQHVSLENVYAAEWYEYIGENGKMSTGLFIVPITNQKKN